MTVLMCDYNHLFDSIKVEGGSKNAYNKWNHGKYIRILNKRLEASENANARGLQKVTGKK